MSFEVFGLRKVFRSHRFKQIWCFLLFSRSAVDILRCHSVLWEVFHFSWHKVSRHRSCAALFRAFRSHPLSFLPLRVGASELTCVWNVIVWICLLRKQKPERLFLPREQLSPAELKPKTLPRRPPRVQLRAFTPSPCVASGGPVPPACSSRLPQPSWSREAHQSSRALTGSASSIWETLGLCACTLGGTSLGALL